MAILIIFFANFPISTNNCTKIHSVSIVQKTRNSGVNPQLEPNPIKLLVNTFHTTGLMFSLSLDLRNKIRNDFSIV